MYFNDCYTAILIFVINICLECVTMLNIAVYNYNVFRFKFVYMLD